MRRFAAVMVMVLASGVAPAEEPVRSIASDSRIEDALAAWTVWVENDLGESGVPAASYSFVYRDELLASGGIGFADPETGSKADADTLYSICSISKLFTSIAVMQLRDAGKLDLDESIGVGTVVRIADRRPPRRRTDLDPTGSDPLRGSPQGIGFALLGPRLRLSDDRADPRATAFAADALPVRSVLPVLKPRDGAAR